MKAITEIGGTTNLNRIGDVIFVHGLNGDPMKSWSHNGSQDGFWPRWLAEDCPNIGIWSLGYEVAASAWKAGALPLFDRANNILAELSVEERLGTKPLCFITHSMGGLLVKKMLFNAENNISPEFSKFKDMVQGLIFLATPHTGADFAPFVNCLKFFRPTIAVKELESHASSLRELDAWYRNNAALRIQTRVYFESRPTRGIWVVNASSADPGIAGVTPISIDADHITIAKPLSRDELIYRGCKQFVGKVFLPSGIGPKQVGLVGQDGSVLSPLSQVKPAKTSGANKPIEIFVSYAQEDKNLQNRLIKHLANLRNQGIIRDWHDGNIIPGTEWKKEIQKHLDSAQVILLLISPDYVASDFCYSVEMRQALEKHEKGTIRVLPILLRPTDYEGASFEKLALLPSNSKPVNTWTNTDEAFQDVIQGIRTAIKAFSENPS